MSSPSLSVGGSVMGDDHLGSADTFAAVAAKHGERRWTPLLVSHLTRLIICWSSPTPSLHPISSAHPPPHPPPTPKPLVLTTHPPAPLFVRFECVEATTGLRAKHSAIHPRSGGTIPARSGQSMSAHNQHLYGETSGFERSPPELNESQCNGAHSACTHTHAGPSFLSSSDTRLSVGSVGSVNSIGSPGGSVDLDEWADDWLDRVSWSEGT